jgi:colicin import membrane protein
VTYDDAISRDKRISRALAVGMHVLFVLLLVFGVSWQQRHAEPTAVVDLWSSLPPPKQEAPVPPPPKPVVKEPPKPLPKPEAKPVPKPEAKPVPKADIALKDKLEKERKLKEQQELERRKERELERRKEEDAKKLKAEARKKEDEKRKLEKERVAEEAEAKRQAAEKQALADKLAKEQAAAQKRIYDEYVRQISNKIKRYIVEPPNLQGNPQVEFDLRLLPGGEVLEPSLRLKRSSGNAAYDQAVERAILKASPLPLPPDPSLFSMFRELNLKIRPKE